MAVADQAPQDHRRSRRGSRITSRKPALRSTLVLGIYVPALVVAALWSALAGSLLGWFPGGESWLVEMAVDLALGAGVGLATVVLTAQMIRFLPPFARLADAMAEVIGPMGLSTVVVAAVASSVAEECLFRGAVQPTLGWVLASVIFAACHFLPDRRFLPWTAFALAAGLGLGALFEWRGTLVAPVTAHFTVNVINLRLLSKRAAGRLS